jgi:hypothetical protein
MKLVCSLNFMNALIVFSLPLFLTAKADT